MRHFTQWEVEQAVRYSLEGGQAVHTHRIIVDYDKAPACFVREVENGRDICHLFDQNLERLIKTARKLGVRVILVEREGSESQHIDLCAGPLRKALELCEADKKKEPKQSQGLLGF